MQARLVEERVWGRREGFLVLNPAGTTPVLVEEGHPAVPGAPIIAEYLDETHGAELGEHRLLPAQARERVEVRRLGDWFHAKFFEEVSAILVTEKVFKRYMTRDQGGGPPDAQSIRVPRRNIRYHLAYLGCLTWNRHWLAGDRM